MRGIGTGGSGTPHDVFNCAVGAISVYLHTMADMTRWADPDHELLTGRDKGIPERAVGMTAAAFLAGRPRLGEFWTPLVVLDDEAMHHNVQIMAGWCRERGLEIMPHGKTTMAPTLWRRQLAAGALGITLATMGQARTARSLGFDSIMLANAAVDEGALRYLAGELADPEFRFVCWADSTATVEAMERGLRQARPPRPVDVCIELGAADGRTAVQAYLASMIELHRAVAHLYDEGEVYVTAGGSAYFDLVAEEFAAAGAGRDRTRFTLRSGAYIVHDDGFYRGISPFDEGAAGLDAPRFRVAMRGLARVVSHPEPGLALLDGGKRDFPYDEGLPIPRLCAADLGGPWRPLSGTEVSALNDQHSYLRMPDAADAAGLPVGSVVALGLSHPCTTFDKWRVLPVVESAASDVVVDLVRTYF
jgi:D-serine deaminase-like pyridoxal phosphate-dependent protein